MGDATLFNLVVAADNKNIIALLVHQDGGARDRQDLHRFYALEVDGHQFPVGELPKRIGSRIQPGI